jgi:hypothetical protein
VWDAAGGPQFVKLSERTVNDGTDGLWMADRRDASDRLAGVFADECRRGAAQLYPELLSNRGHVHPMGAAGHDQQWSSGISIFEPLLAHAARSYEGFEDQRVGDGSYWTSQVLRGSPCRGDRLIEHADTTGQSGGLQNRVHRIAVLDA